MNQQELIRDEVQRQLRAEEPAPKNHLQSELLSLGGGIAGSGLGLLAINPYEYYKEKHDIKKNNRFVDAMTNERDALEALRDIHSGKTTFEDYGEASNVLKEMYKSNEELLNTPDGLNRFLDHPIPARIERIQDIPVTNEDPVEAKRLNQYRRQLARKDFMRRAMPGKNVFDDLGRSMTHPAVSVGGLAGLAGGYYLADKLHDKKHSARE